MHAPFAEQRKLITLAALDARLAGLRYRDRHLPEQDTLDELRTRERAAREGAARAKIRLEDINREHRKALGEMTSLSTRIEHTQQSLADKNLDKSQRRELTLDLAAVERLQQESQARLHEVTVRREALKNDVAHEGAQVDALAQQIAEAEERRATALQDLDAAIASATRERDAVAAEISGPLMQIYTEVAEERGAGAGELLGRRCGACQMELDNTTMAQFADTPLDVVLRCPECTAILVRPEGSHE